MEAIIGVKRSRGFTHNSYALLYSKEGQFDRLLPSVLLYLTDIGFTIPWRGTAQKCNVLIYELYRLSLP